MSSNSFQFKQNSHLHPALSDPSSISRVDKLLGHWVNTNRETQGISECLVERDGDGITVGVTGVGEKGPISWPPEKAQVLANLEEEAGQRAVALAANFDFGFMMAETYIRVNKGVLVIVLFVTFKDKSGRQKYVNREFFYRRD
jgi:hypothetical protein